jgi:hypothetical protein
MAIVDFQCRGLGQTSRRLVRLCVGGLLVLHLLLVISTPAEARFKIASKATVIQVSEQLKKAAKGLLRILRDEAIVESGKSVWNFLVPPEPRPGQTDRILVDLEMQVTELQQQVPQLISAIAHTSGEMRTDFEELLATTQTQIRTLEAILEGQSVNLSLLAQEQEALLAKVDALANRLSIVEKRIDDLTSRVEILEDALIGDCRDLRKSLSLGEEGFRVNPSDLTEIGEESESRELTVWLRVLLDACTSDLTERGLVVQVAAITRGLRKELTSYLTFTSIDSPYASNTNSGLILRQKHRLGRLSASVDGLVRELFVPYTNLQLGSSSNQIGLAVTVFHDGELVASIPTRVMSCRFGSPARCEWQP